MASTTPAFSVAQSPLAPRNILITDGTIGPDPSIVSRRLFIQGSDGSYITPEGTLTNYIVWNYADATLLLDILDTDISAAFTVQWLNSSNVVVDTLTQLYALREFNKQFLVYLGQLQAITPGILQDANYAMNLATFWAYVQYSEDMISIGADVSNSQNLLDKATYMRLNETMFF